MKRGIILLMIMALCLLSGCSAPTGTGSDEAYDDYIVVGFSQVGAESDWRNANTRSMQQALSSENGFRLIIDDAQQKKERQITAIRNFIHQGVDYIVLAPTTEEGWDTVLAEAKAAGIPVIIIDRMIDSTQAGGEGEEGLFTCWIGSDFQKQGDMAVAWLEPMLRDADAAEELLRLDLVRRALNLWSLLMFQSRRARIRYAGVFTL